MDNPKAFISYAWESDDVKKWVKNFATRLREHGVDVKIDQWEVVPGDRMPLFMERSVRENDYVLVICTPTYKHKSDNRLGGVGYEGDIMTGEVLTSCPRGKFIPILKLGSEKESIPSWLLGRYYVDCTTDERYEQNFLEALLSTLYKAGEPAPPLGAIPERFKKKGDVSEQVVEPTPIKIKGILIDEVTTPSNDGTRGSALYKIPFELNRRPDNDWCDLFIESWNHPRVFSSMHRPGIASVIDSKIFLNGTTIEEVEKYHKATLKIAVEMANQAWDDIVGSRNRQRAEENRRTEDHRRNIEDVSRRIRFDD